MPHTPGPWNVKEWRGDTLVYHADYIGSNPTHTHVAYVCGDENALSCNARLISAAPDILEALRIAHDTMKLWDGIAERHGLGTKSLSMAIEKAQQAIAKSTGEAK